MIRELEDLTPSSAARCVLRALCAANNTRGEDSFDFYYATKGQPLELIASDIGFRSGKLRTIDRLTASLWSSGSTGSGDFYLDNMSVTAVSLDVLGDFNGDGTLGIDDLDTLTTAIQLNSVDTQFDLDGSGQVDLADRQHWVTDIKQTWIGDTNLDGLFDSGDMISVFSAGQYEDAIVGNSTWSTGDWNGDGDFESGDLIAAFSDGGYEARPCAAVAAVPEPSTTLLTLVAVLLSSPFALKSKRRDR